MNFAILDERACVQGLSILYMIIINIHKIETYLLFSMKIWELKKMNVELVIGSQWKDRPVKNITTLKIIP